MQKLNQDIIILPEQGGLFVVNNVFSKTALGLDIESLKLLRELELKPAEELYKKYNDSGFNIWKIGFPSFLDCVMGDPSRFKRGVENWSAPLVVSVEGAKQIYEENFMLISDRKSYLERFAPKRSLIDGERFGDLREQIAEAIALHYKGERDWWENQKFIPDGSALRETLYKSVQENFLKSYFKKNLSKGMKAVDLGCGQGHYTRMIAGCTGNAIGIDPNEYAIKSANENQTRGAAFLTRAVGTKNALLEIESSSADFVIMTDSFLHCFQPDMNFPLNSKYLFEDVNRILKPAGTFVVMDPHTLFLYKPWLGKSDRPFTVITEYAKREQAITGSLSWYINLFSKGGFFIKSVAEPLPDRSYKDVDERGYYFASEFPLWLFFELKKQPRG